LFFPALLKRKIIKATTRTTIKIPKPIPALKMPPTIAQLENVVIRQINNAIMEVCFFITMALNRSIAVLFVEFIIM